MPSLMPQPRNAVPLSVRSSISGASKCARTTRAASHGRRCRQARITAVLALTATLGASLAGCATAVPLDPAPDAKNRLCAEVVVRLPPDVAGLARRDTTAQGTGAWGNPAAVLLHCGVPTPGPTTDRCVTVNGVDWVIDERESPMYRFTTFGRTPAVEVVVDSNAVSGTTAITDLSGAVETLPQSAKCTTIGDSN